MLGFIFVAVMCEIGAFVQYDPDELRRLQLVELEILRAIDDLCQRHSIPYFLDSGSVLGAVRHGGFIPWDDDIDIGMLREDYDRFIAAASEGLPEGYRLLRPGFTGGYAPMWAKVMKEGTKFYTCETLEAGLDQGVFVDVFPYDRLCADGSAMRKQVRDCQMLQRASYLYHASSVNIAYQGVVGAVARLGCKAVHGLLRATTSADSLAGKFTLAARPQENLGDRHTVLSYPVEGGFAREDLLPPRRVAFEGHQLPVPRDTEGYLVKKYGEDWERLPPEDQRRNHSPEVLDLGRQDCL